MQMNYELQLKLPVVVLLYVLFKRYTFFFQWVSLQFTNKTYILHVILKSLITQLQFTKWVNYNTEHDLYQYNGYNQHKPHVIKEQRPLQVIINRCFNSMRTTQPYTIVQVVYKTSQDTHAVILRTWEQPIVNIIRLDEIVSIPEFKKTNQSECVRNYDCEHDGSYQHTPIEGDGLKHVLEFVVALDQVEEVEWEPEWVDNGAHDAHDEVSDFVEEVWMLDDW